MAEKYILDVKDRKILAELDSDARQSNNQIGKEVKLSKEVVKYRIDRLIKNGIILRFHTVINYFKLGIIKFKLYLRLTNADKKKEEEMAMYLNNHPKTEWVAITTGRWDIIAGFLVKNINEFDDEVQTILNKFSDYIQEKAVTATLYLAHEKRSFLASKSDNLTRVIYHTSKDEQIKIDGIDEAILRIMANNARIPVTEMAKRLKSTPRIIQYHIKYLERKKIILAYKVHLNPKSIGRIFCKAIIYLSNPTKERLNSLIQYTSSISGAIWPQRVMGNWDFELDMELQSYDEFQDIILDLKEKFSDIIKNHEFCIISKEFKLDLYPNAHRELRY